MLLFGRQDRMSEITDPRRKRILYRATHRGTKESDAVIGGWVKVALPSLPESKLGDVEELLEELDLDLMDWLMGRLPVPTRWRNSVFDEVLEYYRKMGS
jgi:antitoxin CptB